MTTGLRSDFSKVLHVRVLQHVLGTLRSAASCLPRLGNQVVAASALEFSRLGDDRWQRLSSDLVARSAATFGVKRKHTNAKATEQDRGREAVGECTPSSILKEVLHCENPLYNAGRKIRQVEYRSPLYT